MCGEYFLVSVGGNMAGSGKHKRGIGDITPNQKIHEIKNNTGDNSQVIKTVNAQRRAI